MTSMLDSRKILLCITGSIAAYKAPELVRRLQKAGAEVRVCLTPAAARFVSSLALEALTRHPVLSEESESWTNTLNHIDAARWPDAILVAPATANSIAKIALGIADNILLQTLLATRAPLLLAPAANPAMLTHPAIEARLQTLHARGVEIIAPAYGELACGEEGSGALADLDQIVYHTARRLCLDPAWQDRPLIVTGGSTREAIDGVRVLTNLSSGKMARALAVQGWLRGALVTLVGDIDTTELPEDIAIRRVQSAREMLQTLSELLDNADLKRRPALFMAAAVSDYRPAAPVEGKVKKEHLGAHWSLELVQNPDILSSLSRSGIVTIGFKAETDGATALHNAQKMREAKNLDAVALNIISADNPFGGETNEMTWIDATGETAVTRASKAAVAARLLELAARL